MPLHRLGWSHFFEGQFLSWRERGCVPARVTEEHKTYYVIMGESAERPAEVSGRFRHLASARIQYPAVGDWAAVSDAPDCDRAVIHGLLERKSAYTRKGPRSSGMPDTGGRSEAQVLAANVDTVFLVSGLDANFNLRRIERYLSAAWDSGGAPVIILNKADLCPDIAARIDDVGSVAFGIPIHAISAADGQGMEAVEAHLSPGRTGVFLGSSGVGKSTIINRLLGEARLKTNLVRVEGSKGRHTTTSRQMLFLPGGGIVIDTPGLREFRLWDDEGGLSRTFEDVEQLAARCRFSDCRHQTEPGCAIREAIEDGRLDEGRYQSYLKLEKERKFLAMRKDQAAQRQRERQWQKKIRQHQEAVKELKKRGLL